MFKIFLISITFFILFVRSDLCPEHCSCEIIRDIMILDCCRGEPRNPDCYYSVIISRTRTTESIRELKFQFLKLFYVV